MNDYDWLINNRRFNDSEAKRLFSIERARKAQKFHRTIPNYKLTPLESFPYLANMLNLGGIYIKDEGKRLKLNSFKVMGVSFALARFIQKKLGLTDQELTFDLLKDPKTHKALGDITFCSATDGNHGLGLSWVCNELGYKCVIYVHKETTQARINNIEKYNAKVIVVDGNYDDAVRKAEEDAKLNSWQVISDTSWPGYEEVPKWIMQGYNSIILEAQEQFVSMGLLKPTHVLVQAGVGSLAASVISFYTLLFPNDPPKFIVVEPNKAPCLYHSMKINDGEPHSIKGSLDTIMAGLACGDPSPVAFSVIKDLANVFVSIPDYVAARGMRMLSCPLKGDPFMISGESGAAPLGALYSLMTESMDKELKEALGLDSTSIVFMINTEGNTDPEEFRKIIWDGKDQVPPEFRTKLSSH